MSSHLNHVRNDLQYADVLANWDSSFYSKYTRTLRPDSPGAKLLDIGCGVGQVVAQLTAEGYEAHGVDVAEANIARATQISPRCIWYDGHSLPYTSNTFASVGALNVLEHVQAPVTFLREAVRVTAPGGRVVISSPNFLRVLGFNDYHPRMRGFRAKWRNAKALLARRRHHVHCPDTAQFERMPPIVKVPFTPDDDAIVVTNSLDIAFFLKKEGCHILNVACTDRDVHPFIDLLLNFSPLRYAMFNAFVVARKPA